MNKEFNNLKDEELLKKVEELIDGKNDRQRFTDSFLGFCSRLIGVKPKPDADFQLSLKRSLLEKYREREVESHGNFVLKLTTIREFITMKNIKRFGLVGVPALAIILALIFTVVNPKLQMARAMEIAKNDPQIQQLMKNYGVEIKQVELKDGKAYVLLALPEEKLPPLPALKGGEETTGMRGPGQFYITYQDPKTGEVIESSGSIAEIDLKAKKVEKLELIEETMVDITPLTEEEKARAIEIVKSDAKIKEMLPEGAEVVAVKPLPPLKLKIQTTSEENGVRAVAYDEREDRRVNVIFKSERGQDIITVNLSTGAIEGAMSTGKIKALPESEYPQPIKPEFYLEPDETQIDLPGGGEIRMFEGSKPTPPADEKEIYAQILKEIGEDKDQRIKDLLKDNDYEILEVIKSKPVTTKTETEYTTRIETVTVILEKESTKAKYWITIDMGSMNIKSIKTE